VVWALGAYRGPLRRAITGLKYRHERDRATVLGRLVADYLLDHLPWFEETEVIVPMVGGHTEAIASSAAARLQGLWPVVPVLAKATATRPMVSLPSAAARRLWAACDLRPSLRVTQPGWIRGRRVLVIDDVFTDGSTLREVAGVLRRAGAEAVSGLVLARAPRWYP